jgi:3-hydroxyacyl-[acyl-carrier-protein] dehydratase
MSRASKGPAERPPGETTKDNPLALALEQLPHGPEFRFVDRLRSLVPGKAGVGEYRVRGDEPFLRGHFPGQPLFPGVLLVEAAAQLAGIVAQCDPEIPPLGDLKLTALRGARILGSARPGQEITLRARVTGRLGALIQAEVQASVEGQAVLFAEITLGGAQAKGA